VGEGEGEVVAVAVVVVVCSVSYPEKWQVMIRRGYKYRRWLPPHGHQRDKGTQGCEWLEWLEWTLGRRWIESVGGGSFRLGYADCSLLLCVASRTALKPPALAPFGTQTVTLDSDDELIRKFLNTRITRGTPILGANGILIAHLVDGDTTLLLPLSLVYSIPPSALNARISQPQLSSVTN
jgi:hypothetical protein